MVGIIPLEKIFFAHVNFHSLLCVSNESNNLHTSPSFFYPRVSYVVEYVMIIFSKKGLLISRPFLI